MIKKLNMAGCLLHIFQNTLCSSLLPARCIVFSRLISRLVCVICYLFRMYDTFPVNRSGPDVLFNLYKKFAKSKLLSFQTAETRRLVFEPGMIFEGYDCHLMKKELYLHSIFKITGRRTRYPSNIT